MRPLILGIFALPLLGTLPADAGSSTGGSKGGGGPLSKVSSGIGSATGGGSSAPRGGGSSTTSNSSGGTERPYYDCYDRAGHGVICPAGVTGSVILVAQPGTRPLPSYTGDRAKIDFYGGAQKVQDSDGSVSLELAVVDYRFRVAGALSHYFETLPDNNRLTMTLSTLTGGFRIDDMGATAVFLEAGVVHTSTKGDPMADSSITGAIGGVRVEHRLSKRTSLIGDAQTMMFESEIRANAGRLGGGAGHVQASFACSTSTSAPRCTAPSSGCASNPRRGDRLGDATTSPAVDQHIGGSRALHRACCPSRTAAGDLNIGMSLTHPRRPPLGERAPDGAAQLREGGALGRTRRAHEQGVLAGAGADLEADREDPVGVFAHGLVRRGHRLGLPDRDGRERDGLPRELLLDDTQVWRPRADIARVPGARVIVVDPAGIEHEAREPMRADRGP
jgi:hypothetical protein